MGLNSFDANCILKKLDAWHNTALDQLDDIGGWRNATKERFHYAGDASREWRKPPSHFNSDTVFLSTWILANYPQLDPTPLQQFCSFVTLWNDSHSSKGIPPSHQLNVIYERADLLLNSLNQVLIRKIDSKGTPSSEPEATPPADIGQDQKTYKNQGGRPPKWNKLLEMDNKYPQEDDVGRVNKYRQECWVDLDEKNNQQMENGKTKYTNADLIGKLQQARKDAKKNTK